VTDSEQTPHSAQGGNDDTAPVPVDSHGLHVLDDLIAVGRIRQLVYVHLLRADGPLTAAELRARTNYSARACRQAVNALADGGYVEKFPDPTDPRRHKYRLASVSERTG